MTRPQSWRLKYLGKVVVVVVVILFTSITKKVAYYMQNVQSRLI